MSQTQSKNAWRTRTTGPKPWGARLRTGAKDKYFIVTCDAHVNEPLDFLSSRIDPKFKDRLPHIKIDADGSQWLITEGYPPGRIKTPPNRPDLLPPAESWETWDDILAYDEKMEEEDVLRSTTARTVEQRLRDDAVEGVDAEIIFLTKGLLCFASADPEYVVAACRAANRYSHETFGGHPGKLMPMAQIPTCNVDEAIKEIQWAASNGFQGLLLPNRPMFNSLTQPRYPLEYNDKSFEPLWSAIEETGLPITMHVATSGDPRSVGGKGGAIINYSTVITTTYEPCVTLIGSGVFERHRKLKWASIESGISWILMAINQMDYGQRAHHMWSRPVLPNLCSDYFKEHCYSTFVEEPEVLQLLCDMGYENNLLWSNDYPHPEGSFPHSSVTIERSMDNLTDTQRAKVLGLNAAKLFNLKTS